MLTVPDGTVTDPLPIERMFNWAVICGEIHVILAPESIRIEQFTNCDGLTLGGGWPFARAVVDCEASPLSFPAGAKKISITGPTVGLTAFDKQGMGEVPQIYNVVRYVLD